MQKISYPKNRASFISSLSRSFKNFNNGENKLSNNILYGFCYPIVEALDIKEFNMKRLKNLDFNDLKVKLQECKNEYKKLSKEERQNYLSVMTELSNSFHDIAQAKVKEFAMSGKNFFFLKISNNHHNAAKINIDCDFTDEEIEMAIKCSLNSWDFPPLEYYQKLAHFESKPDEPQISFMLSNHLGKFGSNKRLLRLESSSLLTKVTPPESVAAKANFNVYSNAKNLSALEKEKISISEFKSHNENSNANSNAIMNSNNFNNITNGKIPITNACSNQLLPKTNFNGQRQLSKRITFNANNLKQMGSFSSANNKKALTFINVYEDLNNMLSEAYLKQVYMELIKNQLFKYQTLKNFERKTYKGQWILFEDLIKYFSNFILIYKNSNLKIEKNFDLNWYSYKNALYNSDKENKVYLISLKANSSASNTNVNNNINQATININTNNLNINDNTNKDKSNRKPGITSSNMGLNFKNSNNTLNNINNNTLITKDDPIKSNKTNNSNMLFSQDTLLDAKQKKLSIVVEFTPNNGNFMEQLDENFYIIFDIYEINNNNINKTNKPEAPEEKLNVNVINTAYLSANKAEVQQKQYLDSNVNDSILNSSADYNNFITPKNKNKNGNQKIYFTSKSCTYKNSNLKLICENIYLKGFYGIFNKGIFELDKEYILFIKSCFTPFGYNLRILSETGTTEALSYDKYLSTYLGMKVLANFKIPLPNLETDNLYLLAKMLLKTNKLTKLSNKKFHFKFSLSVAQDYYLSQFIDLFMQVHHKCDSMQDVNAKNKPKINPYLESKKLNFGEVIIINFQDLKLEADDEIIVIIFFYSFKNFSSL